MSPSMWWDRFVPRVALLIAALVGIAYGNPIPFEWTGLPELLRTSERLLTRDVLPVDPRTLYAAHDLISPFFLAFLALVGTIVWLAIDRRGKTEVALREIVLVVTRYVLAAELLRHGVGKMFGTELGPADAVDWIRPLGEFERCEIVRVWLGYPPIATLFIGVGEAVTGIMLLIRRTTTLGAVIALIAMTNLAMLGIAYCGATAGAYGVAYAALAGVLIGADRYRLSNFLLLGRPTTPALLKAHWPTSPRMRRAGVALQAVVCGWLVYADGYSAIELWADCGHMSSLRGVYSVVSFTRDGISEPLAYESPKRWRLVAIGNFADRVAIRTVDGTPLNFVAIPILLKDEPNWRRDRATQTAGSIGTLTLVDTASAGTSAPETHTMAYVHPDPDRLFLEGRVGGAAVTAQLRHVENERFSFYRWLWRK